MAVQLFQHQLLKRLSLSHCIAFASFVNDWLTVLHGSVSGLCIDSIDLFASFFFFLMPHSLDLLLLVLFSCQVMSDSLGPHGWRHIRPPCPSSSPRLCPSSCPLSRWCHPTILSSVTVFSFCLQSFPALTIFSQWVHSSHQVVQVLELQLQHQSFQWVFRIGFL